MDVKNTHSVTKTEISVFGRQALDVERRRSPSLADKVLKGDYSQKKAAVREITVEAHPVNGNVRTCYLWD